MRQGYTLKLCHDIGHFRLIAFQEFAASRDIKENVVDGYLIGALSLRLDKIQLLINKIEK